MCPHWPSARSTTSPLGKARSGTWTLQAGLPMSHAAFDAEFLGWAALALLAPKLVAVWATFGTTGVAGLLVITLTAGLKSAGEGHAARVRTSAAMSFRMQSRQDRTALPPARPRRPFSSSAST